MQPAPEAEDDDEQRLDAMDKEGKKGGIGRGNAVEHHHGDDGKMPRTGTVGRGDNDGKRACHKHDQTGLKTEVGTERKAVERQVEMEEVAKPHQDGVEQEKGDVAHTAKGHDALPHVEHHATHALEHDEHAGQPYEQHDDAYHAEQGDVEPGGAEEVDKRGNLGARLAEEGDEDGKLEQEGDTRNEQDAKGIDQALGDDRAQRLGERHMGVARKDAATRHFAHARDDEARGVGQVDGIDQMGRTRTTTQRLQRLTPAQGTLHMAPHAEKERKGHPIPTDAVAQHDGGLSEVEVAIHPVENEGTQQQGKHHLRHAGKPTKRRTRKPRGADKGRAAVVGEPPVIAHFPFFA